MSYNYTQINGGGLVSSNDTSYVLITLTGNVTLTWPNQFMTIIPQNVTFITANYWIDVAPDMSGHIITLPDATQVSVGQTLNFQNKAIGNFSFIVNDNSGNQLFTLTQGQSITIYLSNNTTAAGVWGQKLGAGQLGVTSVNATSSSNNLVIGGVPITGVGTITFALANDLLALTGFGGGVGYAARTAANTWSLRQILGTNNQIVVTNPQGIAGDTVLALDANIQNLVSVDISNITIGGAAGPLQNTIKATNMGGGLAFLAQSTGFSDFYTNVRLNGAGIMFGNNSIYPAASTNFITVQGGAFAANYTVILPTVAPTDGQVLSNTSTTNPYQLGWSDVTTFGGPSTDTAIARFNGVNGSLQDSTVLLSSTGNITPVTNVSNLSITVQDTTSKALGIGTVNGNTIAALNVDGNIVLAPNGTGNLVASSITYPNTDSSYGDVYTTNGSAQIVYSANVTDNLLINGSMDVNQRGNITNATFFTNNNNSWIADGWILLSDGNNIVNSNVLSSSTNAAYQSSFGTPANSLQLTVVTANKKFGILQLLSLNDSQKLKSQIASFSYFVAKNVGTTISNVRGAIVGYTVNSAPSTNIVTAWNGAGANPTLSANWAYINASTNQAVSSAAFTRNIFNSAVAMGTSYNAVGVFVWVDDVTATAGDVLILSGLKFNLGNIATKLQPTRFRDEFIRCQTLMMTDYEYGQVIGANDTGGARTYFTYGGTLLNGNIYNTVEFPNRLNAPTTLSVFAVNNTTLTNQSSTGGAPFSGSSALGANSAVPVANSFTNNGFLIQNNSGGALVLTNGAGMVHYVAVGSYG